MNNLDKRIKQTKDMLKQGEDEGVQQQKIAFQGLKNQLEIMETLKTVLDKIDGSPRKHLGPAV